MSRYQPLPNTSSSPTATPSRPSFASIRRPSFSSMSSFRFSGNSSRHTQLPDPDEMDAAFDGPDDDDDDGEEDREGSERRGLLSRQTAPVAADKSRSDPGRPGAMPGDYDFERDYTQPPAASAPPEYQFPHNASNPAPGNTNGEIPNPLPSRPNPGHANRHFLGGILPTALLPRRGSNTPGGGGRVLGAGQSGVFGNLAARPGEGGNVPRVEGTEYVPELESKDAPPSYQSALRDAVPPYWDTTVVLPSSNSPFGPLSSSISGDEILIDGMPTGNFFGFFWNLIVSFSFQFVGFLLTYVLHTTHAAKYGSRVGLGCTLIQFGLTLRSRAEDLIQTGHFPGSDSIPSDPSASNPEEIAADNAIEALWGPGSPWPASIRDPLLPVDAPPVVLHNIHEAQEYAFRHNETLADLLQLPSAAEVGRANEWFSFLLMSIGWFFILTSLGGWWRVKRFERGLKRAQRESEAAQHEAAVARGDADPNDLSTSATSGSASRGVRGGGGEEIGPRDPRYYTNTFREWVAGIRDIQRGFYGMRGRPVGVSGGGGSVGDGGRRQDGDVGDEHELLDAQGFGLGPMAEGEDGEQEGGGGGGSRRNRRRGLWGI